MPIPTVLGVTKKRYINVAVGRCRRFGSSSGVLDDPIIGGSNDWASSLGNDWDRAMGQDFWIVD